MELLSKAQPPLDWATNCVKFAQKDLRLVYSQGNSTAYPINIKAMARYLSTQYSNNKPANQREDKNGDIKKGMNQNLKTRIVSLAVLPVHMLKKIRQLKSSLSITERLA